MLDHMASTWDGSGGPSQPPAAQRAAETSSQTPCPLCAALLPEGPLPQSTWTELSQPQGLCAGALTRRLESARNSQAGSRRLLSVVRFSLLIHSLVELMPAVHSHHGKCLSPFQGLKYFGTNINLITVVLLSWILTISSVAGQRSPCSPPCIFPFCSSVNPKWFAQWALSVQAALLQRWVEEALKGLTQPQVLFFFFFLTHIYVK